MKYKKIIIGVGITLLTASVSYVYLNTSEPIPTTVTETVGGSTIKDMTVGNVGRDMHIGDDISRRKTTNTHSYGGTKVTNMSGGDDNYTEEIINNYNYEPNEEVNIHPPDKNRVKKTTNKRTHKDRVSKQPTNTETTDDYIPPQLPEEYTPTEVVKPTKVNKEPVRNSYTPLPNTPFIPIVDLRPLEDDIETTARNVSLAISMAVAGDNNLDTKISSNIEDINTTKLRVEEISSKTTEIEEMATTGIEKLTLNKVDDTEFDTVVETLTRDSEDTNSYISDLADRLEELTNRVTTLEDNITTTSKELKDSTVIQDSIITALDDQIGVIAYSLSDRCPSGWVELNGDLTDHSNFDELVDYLNTEDFPDYRNYFVKTFDEEDVRRMGSVEEDSTAVNGLYDSGHRHDFRFEVSDGGTGTASFYATGLDTLGIAGYIYGSTDGATANLEGDSVTEPRNVVLHMCIRGDFSTHY